MRAFLRLAFQRGFLALAVLASLASFGYARASGASLELAAIAPARRAAAMDPAQAIRI